MSATNAHDLAALLRQQESLRGIIESISSELELRPLLTLIVRHACELLEAENGTIGLLDEQRQIISTEAVYQMPADELGSEFPPGVGIFGHILLHPQTIILKRYGDVPHPTQATLIDYTVIGLPILWRNQLIGAFGLGRPALHQFTEHDVEILALFAKHAAIAIVNARLFESERRRTARSTMINEISRQINSSLNLETSLQTAVESINQYLHYPNIALLLTDLEDPQTLVLQARSGIYMQHAKKGYRQNIQVGIIGAAARHRQPILIADVRRDARYLSLPGANDIMSELALPLIVDDRLLGVLNVESKQTISSDQVTDLKIIADQLGIVIDNAHHYAEEKRRTERLELIARVGQRIAVRLDPDELFSATIKELYAQLGYDHVAFFVVDPLDPGWLVQRAYASRWPEAGRVGYRQSIERGIIGAAARQRTFELVNDVHADPRYISVSEKIDLQAELAVPILLGEQLLGVFDVASRKPFLDDDLKAIQIIADQLAVAIDHAYLFADTQRTLEETRLLYRTSQRISVAIDVDDVVQAYLEQVAVRGRYACNIALYEFDDTGRRSAVIVRGRWTPTDGLQCPLMIQVPNVRDALDPLLDVGQTIAICDVHTDARVPEVLRQMQASDGRPALTLIPLMARGRRIGLVILSYPGVYEWPEANLHAYQITAAQLATAIDNRQQIALIARHNQQIAVWEERRRLARELHDSVTQLLFSMTLIAQSIAPAWRRSAAEGEQRMQRLLELSQSALAEMRALLVELRPTEQPLPGATSGLLLVDQQGLAVALQKYSMTIGHENLRIDLDAQAYTRQPATHEATLFRIAQEALNNIVKHAKASHAIICLAVHNGTTRLTVQDNGVGFMLAATTPSPNNTGMGLQTMYERAVALGGQLRVITAPGEGTRVEAILPMN